MKRDDKLVYIIPGIAAVFLIILAMVAPAIQDRQVERQMCHVWYERAIEAAARAQNDTGVSNELEATMDASIYIACRERIR